MPIILPSGFNVTSVEPVDARFALANQAARLGLSTANVYKGLVVFQQDNNTLYVLLDATQPSLNSSWQVVGSAISGSLIASTRRVTCWICGFGTPALPPSIVTATVRRFTLPGALTNTLRVTVFW